MTYATAKNLIFNTLTVVLEDSEWIEWGEQVGFEDEKYDDIFVFKARVQVTYLPRLFKKIFTIFPDHHVTLAEDNFESCDIDLEDSPIAGLKLRGVLVEIGIRAPSRC